jgi:hypothetical protein
MMLSRHLKAGALSPPISERLHTMIPGKCKIGWLVLAVVVANSTAQAQTTLRYKFKEGEKLGYVMEQKMDMQMNVQGNNVQMNMTQTIDMTWHVKSVSKDGKAKMGQSFDRIRFTMDTPMGKVEFDSKDGKVPEGPLGQAVAPVFQAMAGAELSLTMDPQGKTSDVEVPEKLADAIKNLPGGGGLGNILSADSLKQMASQSRAALPDGPVTKGKTWVKNVDMKMPFGTMKVENISTYEGSSPRGDTKLEQIAIKPKMTIEPDPNSPVTIKLKEQDGKGTTYFDNNAGRMVETNLKQNMVMALSVMGMDIEQKIEQVVTMKLKDK